MTFVRILVDGFSLLHGWPKLEPGRQRHAPAARGELIRRLTAYQDSVQIPVTVVFDGSGSWTRSNIPEAEPVAPIEVLYARADQTADQLIERAAVLLREYGDVLVVTNDAAERETVAAAGVEVVNCQTFIIMIEGAIADLDQECRRARKTTEFEFRNHARYQKK